MTSKCLIFVMVSLALPSSFPCQQTTPELTFKLALISSEGVRENVRVHVVISPKLKQFSIC